MTLVGFVRGDPPVANLYTPGRRPLMGWREQLTGWRRSGWAGLRPNGAGLQKPHHYRDMAQGGVGQPRPPEVRARRAHQGRVRRVRARRGRPPRLDHRRHPPLHHAAAACSSSTPPTRSTRVLLADVGAAPRPELHASCGASAGSAHPMRRRRGEPGFRRIALGRGARCARRRHRAHATRAGRALPHQPRHHERDLLRGRQGGPRHGRRQHRLRRRACATRPSTVGLKETIGVAAATCSLQDVIESDLVVLWGTNPANNQPVFMKYLYLAKKRGCRVVVVNPYLEPGLERYWVPSSLESAAVRHQGVRPARAGAAGRRRGPRQRHAQAPDRPRRRRPTPSSTPTPRDGTSSSAALGRAGRR